MELRDRLQMPRVVFGRVVNVSERTIAKVEAEAEEVEPAQDALESKDALIYNVGSGQGFSVRQVVEAARAVTGIAIPAIEEPRRAGDPPRLVASSDKIRRELGWKPEHTDLKEMVSSAWEWHKSHPKGYDSQ